MNDGTGSLRPQHADLLPSVYAALRSGIPRTTAYRRGLFARAWLRTQLN